MPKVKLSKTILLTVGSALGALLFAPKSGKKLRKYIKREAEKQLDDAKVYATNLKEDVKASYKESKLQAEHERQMMIEQEAELARTIAEIEQELEERDLNEGEVHGAEPTHVDEGSLDDVPDNVLKDTDLGNVQGTTQDPDHDEVIPADELDEALDDQNLEDNPEFDID